MKDDDTRTTELPAELLPGDDAPEENIDTSRVSGWRRILRGNRTLWIVALCAVVSLVAGLLVGRFLISPAEAGAVRQHHQMGTIAGAELGEQVAHVRLDRRVAHHEAVGDLEVRLDARLRHGLGQHGGAPGDYGCFVCYG